MNMTDPQPENTPPEPAVPSEQSAYARLLGIGSSLGLLALAAAFGVYLLGIIPQTIPLDELANHWHKTPEAYHQVIDAKLDQPVEGGTVTGWGWVKHAFSRSDYLCYIGICMLAGITILCYINMIPRLIKKGDRLYLAIAVLEIIVLLLAASGVFSMH